MRTEPSSLNNKVEISEINTDSLLLTGSGLSPAERPRSLSGTARRIENMHKLVGELLAHEMRADEIATTLNYSSSGARKYIRHLREEGVIERDRYLNATASYLGMPVYRLTLDPERVRVFLAALVAPKCDDNKVRKKERSALPERIKGEPGRHFHLLGDDTDYAIRVSRETAQRDPLVAALFGPARRQAKV